MKRLFLLTLVALVSLGMMAGEVTEQQALQKAREFLNGKQLTKSATRRAGQKAGERQAFYVFNAQDNGGFVIVSADDRTEEILGYADQGHLDLNNMPDNLKAWLQGYQETILSLPEGSTTRRAPAHNWEEVPVLIQSRWGQNEPYNWQCPKDGDGRQCITGCVATAMAQVMYYHRWPEATTKPIPAYATGELKLFCQELPPVVFDWDHMQDTYPYSGSGKTEGTAVATLMRYCGQALQMNYGPWSSSAYTSDIPRLLYSYFGYSATGQYVNRSNYTTAEWEQLVYDELKAQRPVIYDGRNSSGGHAFICDGYKDGKFHFNWGWDGSSDGYFTISMVSDIEYNAYQSAGIGIKPDQGEAVLPVLKGWGIYCNEGEFLRNEWYLIGGQFFSETAPFSGKYGFALYQGDQFVQIQECWDEPFDANYYQWKNLMEPYNVPNGEYTVKMVYQYEGSDEWRVCSGTQPVTLIATDDKIEVKSIAPVEYVEKLLANSAALNGQLRIGHPVTLDINLTNVGTSKEQTLVLNRKNTQTGNYDEVIVGINLDPGATADVSMPFTFEEPGEYTMTLSLGYGDNELWSQTVTVENVPQHDLSGKAVFTNSTFDLYENTCYLPDTEADGTVTITNNGNYDYDDDIIFVLIDYDTWKEVKRWTVSANIPAGSTKDVPFQMTGLEQGRSYYLQMNFYSGASYYNYIWGVNLMAGAQPVTLKAAVTVDGLDRNSVPGEDITGTLFLENVGDYAYDGDIVIQAYDLDKQAVAKLITVPNVSVAVGESGVEVPFSITGLKAGGMYNIAWYYYIGKSLTWLSNVECQTATTPRPYDMSVRQTGCKINGNQVIFHYAVTNHSPYEYNDQFRSFLGYNDGDRDWQWGNSGIRRLVVPAGETKIIVCEYDWVSTGVTYTPHFAYRTYHEKWVDDSYDAFDMQGDTVEGDANDDGKTSVTDAFGMVNYMQDGQGDINTAAADINGDGVVDLADVAAAANIIMEGEDAHTSEYSPFIYYIGSTDGWNNDEPNRQKLALTDNSGIYTGYIYCADPLKTGNELKFQIIPGDWNSQFNRWWFATITGDFSESDDKNNYNIQVNGGEGVYYVTLDIPNRALTGVKVNTMGVVGGFNNWGNDGTDVVMTWNADDYCYEATGVGATGSPQNWKFRVNYGWDINLGGDLNDLRQYGTDIEVDANTIKLYPTRRTSDNIYCTVE